MTYSATNTYATTANIQERTGDIGWKNMVDMDGDGSIDSVELTNAENAIESANNILDAALQSHFAVTPRTAGNDWLRDRCIEIAIYRISGLGGRDIPETISNDYDDALKMLDQVRGGSLKIPGLTYPLPENYTGRSRRLPRAINVGRRKNFKRRRGY